MFLFGAWGCLLCFHSTHLNVLFSVQFPVLVNRGWVPRIWRDKSFEVSQDREKSSSTDAVPVQQNERSWWGMFQSKKQKAVEVVSCHPLNPLLLPMTYILGEKV